MAKLLWDQPGTRFYETGLDRGVLFVGTQEGVAWSGLISVDESPTGAEAKPYYIDGFKYLNIAAVEEFEATITAFSAPAEFAPCDGRTFLNNGLIATQQPRVPFNFSYRTKIGNDIDGVDYAYKIHIVYNALAAAAGRNYSTTGDSAEAAQLSWSVTTLPPAMTGLKPTAHFAIDTRASSPAFLTALEDFLYGTDVDQSRLPTPQELMTLASTL